MDSIIISNEKNKKYITVIIERDITSNIDILREAAKILQREVLRYEANHGRPFNW